MEAQQFNLSQFGEVQNPDPRPLEKDFANAPISVRWEGRSVELATPTFIDREFLGFLAALGASFRAAEEFGSKEAVNSYWSSSVQICNISLRIGKFAPSEPLALFRDKYAGLTQMTIDLYHENRNVTVRVVTRLSEIFNNFFAIKDKCTQYLAVPCPEHLKENNECNRKKFAVLALEIDKIAKNLSPLSEAVDDFARNQSVKFRQVLIINKVTRCEKELEQLKQNWLSLKANKELSSPNKAALGKALRVTIETKKQELEYLRMLQTFVETDRLFMQRLHAAIGTEGTFTKNLDWLGRYMHNLSTYNDKMSEEDIMCHESFAGRYGPATFPYAFVRLNRPENEVIRTRSASTSNLPFPAASEAVPTTVRRFSASGMLPKLVEEEESDI